MSIHTHSYFGPWVIMGSRREVVIGELQILGSKNKYIKIKFGFLGVNIKLAMVQPAKTVDNIKIFFVISIDIEPIKLVHIDRSNWIFNKIFRRGSLRPRRASSQHGVHTNFLKQSVVTTLPSLIFVRSSTFAEGARPLTQD